MMNESKSSIKQFESELGKIVTLIKLGKIVIRTESCDVVPGEFPITEWRSFPLEIPSSGHKKYITGRFPGGYHKEPIKEKSEIINIPVFTGEDVCDARTFEEVTSDPEKMRELTNIPVVIIATKNCGQYSDGRGIQLLSVLPIWNDKTSMVLELDWHEGNPLEDAVNPEWHIRVSPRLSLSEGLQKLKECSKQPSIVEKCSHYLYVNPPSLGTRVLGEGQEYPGKTWPREWKFDECKKMLDAIGRLAETVTQF